MLRCYAGGTAVDVADDPRGSVTGCDDRLEHCIYTFRDTGYKQSAGGLRVAIELALPFRRAVGKRDARIVAFPVARRCACDEALLRQSRGIFQERQGGGLDRYRLARAARHLQCVP